MMPSSGMFSLKTFAWWLTHCLCSENTVYFPEFFKCNVDSTDYIMPLLKFLALGKSVCAHARFHFNYYFHNLFLGISLKYILEMLLKYKNAYNKYSEIQSSAFLLWQQLLVL